MSTIMVSAPFSIYMQEDDRGGYIFDPNAKQRVSKVLELLSQSGDDILSSHISDSYGEKPWDNNFVTRDFGWVKSCDVMVVLLPSKADGELYRSDGTMIELGYAKALNKTIIILHDEYEEKKNSFFICDLINNSQSLLWEKGWDKKLLELLMDTFGDPTRPIPETRRQTTDVDHMLANLAKTEESHDVMVSGMQLRILPGVLSPKFSHAPDALMSVWEIPENADVLDIGCGCGVLGISALQQGARSLVALDINEQAVANTQLNLERLSLNDRGEVRTSDAYSALRPGETFDTIIFAAPYWNRKADTDLELSCFDHEYVFLTQVISEAHIWLKQSGKLYMIFSDQGDVSLVSKLIDESQLGVSNLSLQRPTQPGGHIRIIWELYKK